MDRNTLTGLVLIGLLLVGLSLYNQYEQTEQAEKEQQEQVEIDKNKPKNTASENKKIVADTTKKDTLKTPVNEVKTVKSGKLVRKETDKFIIDFKTKGGTVNAVYLKDYRSYDHFKENKTAPLCLFRSGDHSNTLSFPYGKTQFNATDSVWNISSETSSKIIFELSFPDGKVQQSYSLKNGAFDLDYDVQLIGLPNVARGNVNLLWGASFLRTERLFTEQRRVTTVCYNQAEEGFDYLSESSDDYAEAEDDITWVAYKQSYFSSILKPSKPFLKAGSNLKVETYGEGHAREFSHLKEFYSKLNLNFENDKASFNWYFGPNDYDVLASYDQGYDDILNYGWGLFRWINIYAVQPIFKLLVNGGIGVGVAILLLTIILKLLLMPIQWKMFVSSVKMKILRPEIEALNAKFPNKEDAMKKQMEMMNLYRDSGASPLAGCIPMLIQMPILLAVFRFFPAAFELRQQPFLWAEDLSSYDSIVDFGFKIPLYGDHISLFTLLMAATTLVYTFMNSGNMQQPTQPGMPNMKVIMYIFPILMIFFFNEYSAGLSYYYFISTLISIIIMVVIKRFFVDEEKLKLKMADRKAKVTNTDGSRKKSKFQEKLEEMQRKQQEMLKNKKR
ncbi:MAG: membrane protein insertase YidC [Crocinitomicaceae bacterium]